MAQHDAERDMRISLKVMADIDYDEQIMPSWHGYLEQVLGFPFKARGRVGRASSWPSEDDVVVVRGMLDESDCHDDMLVYVECEGDELPVPLVELEAVSASPKTVEAIEDWHYWVDQ